jgi:FkbM family methyltransferase
MKLIKTKLGKHSFFYKKGDKTIGERISLRKFERFETFLMTHLSRNRGIAVDVGANIGYYSVILSGLTNKVISFEPDPISLKLLKKNITENGIKNVQVIGKAASDVVSSLTLGISKSNLGDHQIDSKEKNRIKVSIKSSTLDKIVKEKVSILKIDTQGWEPKVILGGKKMISKDLPDLFLEYWPDGYKRSSLDYKKMIKFLENKYGKIYLIDDELRLVYPVSSESLERRCHTKTGYVDLIFKKNVTWGDRWLFVKKFRLKKLIKKLIGVR